MEPYKKRCVICFFDSGIGGLNVMRECAALVKDADFAYFADNFNIPYGSLSDDKLFALADEKFALMARLNPLAAVIACNTVTAVCAAKLRQKYAFPIIGIQPAVKPAAKEGKRCAVLATTATAHSKSLKELVLKHGNGVTEIYPCEGLAAFIEENISQILSSRKAAGKSGEARQAYLKIMKRQMWSYLPKIKTDKIVLGCTHYSFVSDIISSFYGCEVFDGKGGVAKRLAQIVGKSDHQIFSDAGEREVVPHYPRKISFFCGNTAKNAAVYSLMSE